MLWKEILIVCWRDENEELCDAMEHARTLARPLLWEGAAHISYGEGGAGCRERMIDMFDPNNIAIFLK